MSKRDDISQALPAKVGPYRLEKRLGVGGVGEVFRAFDERLGRSVALKRIRPERAADAAARERFLREARLAARLDHPVLVPVHDVLEVDSQWWMVMEWVEGRRLDHLLADAPLPLEHALALAKDIASGLAAIQAAGIVHRDIKSANIMVTPRSEVDSDLPTARLLDFGLATAEDESLPTSGEPPSRRAWAGTPRAMSPEQAMGRPLDQRSDLFALGIVFYELFTGRAPFRGRGSLETLARICHQEPVPASDLVQDLPQRLGRLIDRLLAKDPDDRPASCDEVLAVLDELGDERYRRSLGVSGNDGQGAELGQGRAQASTTHPLFERSGERRQVTLLCGELGKIPSADGASLDSLDPEQLHGVLDRFRSLIFQALEHFGGHLGEFQGHRVTLYFGYPEAYEDAARRAVLCALELAERSSRLGEEREPWTVRAGVYTGLAVIVSGESSSERVILGRTLDRAAEVQASAPPGAVVISAHTRRLVEGMFLDSEHSSADVPGPLYRVLGQRERPTWPEDRSPLPTVGRHRELRLLLERLQLAREGTGQAIVLSAAAGLGKTHLVQSLRQHAPDDRWLVMEGAQLKRHRALSPFAELASQLGHRESPLPPPFHSANMRAEECRVAIERLLEWLREITDAPQHDAVRRTTVLLVEQLQWLDPHSLDVISRLVERCWSLRMLVVTTCRPGFIVPWGQRGHVTFLPLAPLENHDIEELVDHLMGDHPLSTNVRDSIVRRSGGVPLFARELTRDAVEAALTEGAEGIHEPLLPATLRDLLTTELERVGSACDVAQVAAQLGSTFTRRDLGAQLGAERDEVEHELDRLLATGILVPDGASQERLRFRHPLLREAALAYVLAEDRAQRERAPASRSDEILEP